MPKKLSLATYLMSDLQVLVRNGAGAHGAKMGGENSTRSRNHDEEKRARTWHVSTF